MNLLDGKKVAETILREVKGEVECLKKKNITLSLHALLVGDDPASQIYVKKKEVTCQRLGIQGVVHRLAGDTTEKAVLSLIHELNKDKEVDGILIQLPLPSQIHAGKILEAVDPAKDVDGFHPINMGNLFVGTPSLIPCTPLGILNLLKYYDIPLEGAHAVMVGRSNIVGKPMGILLLQHHATLTFCHSRTKDLAKHTRQGDILIAAAGKPGLITAEMVKPGAVVVDVGIHRVTEEALVDRIYPYNTKKQAQFAKKGYVLAGDVCFDKVAEKASWITPVPGGVGPLTIAGLVWNTLQAGKRRRGLC